MIDMGEAKLDLWKEIFGDENIRHCFTCGRCVAGCPASEARDPLRIRSIVRMVLLGLEDELLDEDSPWGCVTCTRCEEMCPMGVRPFEVGLAVRKWQCANDETRIPPAIVDLYTRGYSMPVGANPDLREELGLEREMPLITKDPELHEKWKKVLMSVKLIKDNDYMFGE